MIDLRTLRPLDYDTVIASVQKTNRCVTVEEGFPVCSIGQPPLGLHHDACLSITSTRRC